ncbi:MAG: CHAT domain-containing protein [Vicinamibacteria bacterium]
MTPLALVLPALLSASPLVRGSEQRVACGTTLPLALAAGEWIELEAVPTRADVLLRLESLDGRTLAEADDWQAFAPERVRWVAAEAAVLRLVVAAAPSSAQVGPVSVRVLERRAATPDDRRRIEADATLRSGIRLERTGRAESLEQAARWYEKVAADSEAAQHAAGRGEALVRLGFLRCAQGRAGDALQPFRDALAALRVAPDRRTEAAALRGIGLARWMLADYEEARQRHEASLVLARETGDVAAEAAAQHELGRVHWESGARPRALEVWQQALRLRRAAGDRLGEASTLKNVGLALGEAGRYQEALAAQHDALELRRAIGDRRGEGDSLNALGLLYWQLGDPGRALELFERALPLRREVGDRRGEAITIHNAGLARIDAGDVPAAIRDLQAALQLKRALGDRLEERNALNAIGEAQLALGRPRDSLPWFEQALASGRELGARAQIGVTLARISRARLASGEPEAALAAADEAELFLSPGSAAFERAQALLGLGRLPEALHHLEELLGRIEATRENVASPELRAVFLGPWQQVYSAAVEARMRLHALEPGAGHAAAGFQVAERGRARSLLDTLAETGLDLRAGVDPGLLADESRLAAELNRAAERLDRTERGADGSRAAVEREVARLDRELQELRGRIRAASPRSASLTRPEPLSLHQVQGLLDDETVLLEFVEGDLRSHVFAVARDAFAVHELPARSSLDAAARRAYALLSTSRSAGLQAQTAAALGRLGHLLLGPLREDLAKRRVVIIPDGASARVPFAALPDPSRPGAPPLVAHHEVVIAPSASALAVLRAARSGRPAAERGVAVLADAVFDRSDPRLPGPAPAPRAPRSVLRSGAAADLARLPASRAEAETIARLAGPGTLLALGFDADRALLESGELARYRVLHLATHALLDERRPALSALALSLFARDGSARDGLLRLHDIYQLRLAADLVVLSACQTALGREIRGEGMLGLTRGFMHAGAPSVLASLWKVRDAATAELMKLFYAELLTQGKAPAAALRQAQLRMLRDPRWSAPQAWASFVLQGDWK